MRPQITIPSDAYRCPGEGCFSYERVTREEFELFNMTHEKVIKKFIVNQEMCESRRQSLINLIESYNQ